MGDTVTITSLKINETTQKIAVRYVIPKVSALLSPDAVVTSAKIYYNVDNPVTSAPGGYTDVANVLAEYTPGKRSKHTFTSMSRDHVYYFLLEVVVAPEDEGSSVTFTDKDDVYLTRMHGRYMVKIENPVAASGEDPWVDITPYIEGLSYDVNNTPVFETWDDANYTKHYELTRIKIQGTFKVQLYTREIYNRFIDLVSKNITQNTSNGKKTGLVHMKVQVNNELDDDSAETLRTKLPELYKGWFHLEYSPVWTIPFLGIKEVESIEVKIEEE